MPGFTKEGLDILLYALICMKSMLPSYLWPYCIRIICLLLCFLTRLEFIECGYHVSFTSVSPTSNIGCGWKKMLNTGLLNYTELSSLVQSIEEIFYSSKKVTLSTQSPQLSISLVKKKKKHRRGSHKLWSSMLTNWLPRWFSGKHACQCRRRGFHSWVRKIPWRRKRQPTPGFLPGKFHGQRSLVGYSLLGWKELNTTEQLI